MMHFIPPRFLSFNFTQSIQYNNFVTCRLWTYASETALRHLILLYFGSATLHATTEDNATYGKQEISDTTEPSSALYVHITNIKSFKTYQKINAEVKEGDYCGLRVFLSHFLLPEIAL